MIKTIFTFFQVLTKSSSRHAVKLLEAMFGRRPETLDAIDVNITDSEVVRYEYPMPPANEMFFYLKAKVETGARFAFYIQFRDKDGILVGAQNDYGNGIPMTKVFYTAIGETGKASAYIPSEKEMEKVVSAKVIRIKQ